MRISKVSDENKLSVFDVLASNHVPINQREPEMKQHRQKEADRSWAEQSTAAKLEHNTPDSIDLCRKGNSIRSARCAPDGITNEKGPSNGFGISGRNSIFDSEVLSRLAETETGREKTIQEKESSNKIRKEKAEEWKSASQQQLGEDEEDFINRRGSSAVNSRSSETNRRQWVPQNAISMFDNTDFERLQETPGQSIERRKSSKDDSWRHAKSAKAKSIQEKQSEMIDRLTEASQDNSYRNQHQDATDRLFNILKEKKSE